MQLSCFIGSIDAPYVAGTLLSSIPNELHRLIKFYESMPPDFLELQRNKSDRKQILFQLSEDELGINVPSVAGTLLSSIPNELHRLIKFYEPKPPDFLKLQQDKTCWKVMLFYLSQHESFFVDTNKKPIYSKNDLKEAFSAFPTHLISGTRFSFLPAGLHPSAHNFPKRLSEEDIMLYYDSDRPRSACHSETTRSLCLMLKKLHQMEKTKGAAYAELVSNSIRTVKYRQGDFILAKYEYTPDAYSKPIALFLAWGD
jgi:hypothetical protein